MVETASSPLSMSTCYEISGTSVDSSTAPVATSLFMTADELVAVVEEPATTSSTGLNFVSPYSQQQTIPITYVYPAVAQGQQPFLLNYQSPTHLDATFGCPRTESHVSQPYAIMSTTDFSHPPPTASLPSAAIYRPSAGNVIVAATPPTMANFVPIPAGGAFLTAESFSGSGDSATPTAYPSPADHHQLSNYSPYLYPAAPPQPVVAYSHFQPLQHQPLAFGQNSTQHHYAKAPPSQQKPNSRHQAGSSAAFSSSDTGSSFMKASAASDTASSCSGGGGGGGRNSAAEAPVGFNGQQRGGVRNHNSTNLQMRRYSDPRPSTSRQRQSQQNESSSEIGVGPIIADSSSNVSKTSTVKSTGVDSVDSADSGLTADHSSPEHRTSTPTTSHIAPYHYQASPVQQHPSSRPQTLMFQSGGTTADNQQPTSSNNSTSTAALNSSGNALAATGANSGGVDRSRSSSPPPPPPPSNGDGGNNAGGASTGVGIGLGFPPVGQHAVYVHVNLGETLSVRVGNEIQNIPGPATVRMVSSHNAGPPVPLPLHVPPGHVVQQIVDENGTLRHLILSPQTPQPPATAGGPFPCVNVPNGSMGPSLQLVPVNGTSAPPGRVQVPPAITGHVPTPPNGAGPLPVAVLAPGECPPGPSYAHHPPHQVAGQPSLVAVAPMSAHHPQMAPIAATRHPLHLHTNPPHICQLHINGANGDDGHLYPPGERVYVGKMMNRNGAKNVGVNSQTSGGGAVQRNYHNDYQDQDNSPMHDATMDDNTSAATSGGNEDEEICKIAEMLSRIPPPQVCDIGPRDALVQWQPFDCSEASASGGPFPQIDASEFTYEILLYERRPEGKPSSNYRCQADQLQQQWLSNLKPSTEYYVRLRALLEERGLHGEPSPAVAFKTKPTHPDRLQPPRVQQRMKTWLTLRWQPPCDNGAKITGYHLEVDDGGSGSDGNFKEVYFGIAKQFKLLRLQPSTLYRIRLAASNEHGKSEYSDILLVQTSGAPPLQPDPPFLVQATSHSLAMQWHRREGDEEFQLLMEDPQTGHGYLPVATTRDVNYLVQNLIRYKEYRFRLTASNEDGRSLPSDAVTLRTLPARPQAPAKPHAKGRVASNNVKIAWEPPRDTGGGEITSYALDRCNEHSGPPSNGHWSTIYEGPEHEFHVVGLEPGVLYRFRVACCSSGGRSPYSDEIALTTSPVPPGPCRAPVLHGKAKSTSLHLKWSPPEFGGGAEISEYELVIDVSSSQQPQTPTKSSTDSETHPLSPSAISSRAVYQGPRTDFAVSAGLLPGRTYAFRVRACNRAGAGAWSDKFECQTAPAAPECPQRLRLVAQASTSVHLAWDAPTSNNGAPITEYRLHQACRVTRAEVPSVVGDPRQPSSTESEGQVVSPSSPSPSKSRSTSTQSSVVSPTSGAGPAPVRQASTTSSASSAPAPTLDSPGSALDSDYGAMTQIYVGATLSYEAKSLRPATDYVFRIQAVNLAGFSRLSDPLFCRTPPGVPESPFNLRTEVLSLAEVLVAWDAPFDNGSPIAGYYLDVSPPPSTSSSDAVSSDPPLIALSACSQQHIVEHLSPETSYKFRVQAFNEVGAGPFSSPVKAVTFSPPPPPPVLELAVAAHNSLKLRWNEPLASASASDNTITYALEMENKSGAFSPVAAELTSRSCKVPRLNECTTYRFRIRACSATGGLGPWSEIFAFKTSRSPPPAVKSAPRISDVTENSCQIDWQPVKLVSVGSSWASGEKLHYSVQIQGPSSGVASSSGDDFRSIYKGASTSYYLSGLAQGSSYRVRVCTMRVSPPDADCTKETETYGAPSATCSVSTISTAVQRRKSSESASVDAGHVEETVDGGLVSRIRHGPYHLSDSQWAILILFMFSLLALLAAFLLQRFIPSSSQTS